KREKFHYQNSILWCLLGNRNMSTDVVRIVLGRGSHRTSDTRDFLCFDSETQVGCVVIPQRSCFNVRYSTCFTGICIALEAAGTSGTASPRLFLSNTRSA